MLPLPLEPLALHDSGIIVFRRPLHELGSRIKKRKSISGELLKQSIIVLALSIFRGHFYQNILLLRPEALYHSLEKTVSHVKNSGQKFCSTPGTLPTPYFTAQDLESFTKRYPCLLESAHYFKPISEGLQSDDHPFRISSALNGPMVLIPDFSAYKEISPQTVRSYFDKAWSIKFPSTKAMRHAKRVTQLTFAKLYHFSSQN
ncbi:hypothetical protein [Parachlamydia sp.]|uniref:hypothetical protein n=1 Tax=Parachlamydia sp. TaxID=2052048 RepID=UPI003D0E1C7F